MQDSNQEKGRLGEELAATYLEANGFRVLARNYRFQRAELDLVCFLPASRYEDGGELVFVEVKMRSSASFAHPEEAVNAAKQQQLIRAARSYLYEHRLEGAICRFDVIAITIEKGQPEISHIENAFQI